MLKHFPLVHPLERQVISLLNDMTKNVFNDPKVFGNYPPMNIFEDITEDKVSVVFEVAVAGFRKDELNVSVIDKSTLVISGERNRTEEPPADYILNKIATRSFEKQFKFQELIDNVDVSLKDGILKIIVFISTAGSKSTIEIKD